MKTTIQIIILILAPFNIFGQSENIDSGKYHPAKEIFKKNIKKENIKNLIDLKFKSNT